MHAVRVKSVLKATADEAKAGGWSAALGTSVVLSGPNGSGKSRLIEAIELVLTGRISGFAGRAKPVKAARMLWRAKPAQADTLWSEVTFSDGAVWRWEQQRSNGKPLWTRNGEPADGPPSGGALFGVEELRRNLFGAPKTAEVWLARTLGVTTRAVLDRIQEEEDARVDRGEPRVLGDAQWTALSAMGEPGTTPGDLLATLKSRASEAQAEAKAAARTVEKLEQYAGAVVTDEDLRTAKVAVESARQDHEAATKAASTYATVSELWQQAQEANRAFGALPDVSPNDVAGLEAARQFRATLDLVARLYPEAPACPCCKQAVQPGQLDQRRAGLEEYIRVREEAANTLSRREALQQQWNAAQREATRLYAELPAEVSEAIQQGTWTDRTEATAKALEAAEATLDDLQRRRVAAQAPGMAEQAALEASGKATMYQGAAKAVESALTALVKEATRDFEGATARFYPTHFGKPRIRLRPSVEIGVDREGVLADPSDGERAVLLLSMAAALAQARVQGDEEGGPEVLLMLVSEDRGYDRQTVQSVLDAFRDWGAGQVFFATTIPINYADGWTVLRVGGDEEATAGGEGGGRAGATPSTEAMEPVDPGLDLLDPSEASEDLSDEELEQFGREMEDILSGSMSGGRPPQGEA